MRLRWIGELRRVVYEARNDGEQRFVDGSERNAILRACEPCGVVEAIQQRMRMGRAYRFDACRIRIAIAADGIARLARAHQIAETEVRARVQILIIEAG